MMLDLEVVLDGAEPRVWRRFHLSERATFLDLHEAIQDACGWLNHHAFRFFGDDGATIAGLPDPDDPDTEPDAKDFPVDGWHPEGFDLASTAKHFDR